MGFAIVELRSPANRRATGSAVCAFTINDPESPGELNVVLSISTWLSYVTRKVDFEPQVFSYCTWTVTFVAAIVSQVRPLVRPLLATGIPIAGATIVLAGGAG